MIFIFFKWSKHRFQTKQASGKLLNIFKLGNTSTVSADYDFRFRFQPLTLLLLKKSNPEVAHQQNGNANLHKIQQIFFYRQPHRCSPTILQPPSEYNLYTVQNSPFISFRISLICNSWVIWRNFHIWINKTTRNFHK